MLQPENTGVILHPSSPFLLTLYNVTATFLRAGCGVEFDSISISVCHVDQLFKVKGKPNFKRILRFVYIFFY